MKRTLLIFVILIIGASLVFADLGPKPSVQINLSYEGQSLQETPTALMLGGCGNDKNEQLNLIDFENALQEQLNMVSSDSGKTNHFSSWLQDNHFKSAYFDGTRSWCVAILAWQSGASPTGLRFGYMPPTDFRLLLYAPDLDKWFLSGEVTRTQFDSVFTADLKNDGTIALQETIPVLNVFNPNSAGFRNFWIAFVVTIILELITCAFIIKVKKMRRAVGSVLLANIISIPIVWFVLPAVLSSTGIGVLAIILVYEIFAVLFEAAIIWGINKEEISSKRALLISIAINLVSFFIGNFFLLMIGIPPVM